MHCFSWGKSPMRKRNIRADFTGLFFLIDFLF